MVRRRVSSPIQPRNAPRTTLPVDSAKPGGMTMELPVELTRNRSGFHRELERLQDEVLVLGSMVEKAVSRSVDALRARDTATAMALRAEDVLINRKRFEIEEAALL